MFHRIWALIASKTVITCKIASVFSQLPHGQAGGPGEVDQVPPTGRGRGPGRGTRRGAGTTYRQGTRRGSSIAHRQAGGPVEVKQVPPTVRGNRRGTCTTYRQGKQARWYLLLCLLPLPVGDTCSTSPVPLLVCGLYLILA